MTAADTGDEHYMCCLPFHAIMKAESCALRYIRANDEAVLNDGGKSELRGTACRCCPTGAINAGLLRPESIVRVRVAKAIPERVCMRCRETYRPTGFRQRICLTCKNPVKEENTVVRRLPAGIVRRAKKESA